MLPFTHLLTPKLVKKGGLLCSAAPPPPPLCFDALVVHRFYYLWPGLLRGKTFRMFLELLVALRLKVPLSCSAILGLSQAWSASANIIFPTCLLTSMHSLFQQEGLLTIREQQLQCEIQTAKNKILFPAQRDLTIQNTAFLVVQESCRPRHQGDWSGDSMTSRSLGTFGNLEIPTLYKF